MIRFTGFVVAIAFLTLGASRLIAGTQALGDPPRERLHRSSRRTDLVLSEIMYDPGGWAGVRNLEYVELFNSGPATVDLDGWVLSGDIEYAFPADASIAPRSFLVVAAEPGDVEAQYGLTGVLGPFAGTLNRDERELFLHHANGGLVQEMEYKAGMPWPAAAAGTGHSLVLARPSYGQDESTAWEASVWKGGSPGSHEPEPPADPLDAIRINEFLAHTDEPAVDFVELYNHGEQSVDVSGAWLSDKPDENRFQIPASTVISPGGFLVFDQVELGFALSSAGEGVYLVNPGNTRVVDSIAFGAQLNGVSMGRYPDGASEFALLGAQTPGASNAGADLYASPVIINEIMFHPINNNANDTYVEIHNPGDVAVDMTDWRFVDGISYEFPDGKMLPAGGYLVVAENADRLIARYPQLDHSNTIGDFDGRLSDSGERVALAMPSYRTVEPTDYIVVDKLHYRDGDRWGASVRRDNANLELLDPRGNNRGKWADRNGSSLELVDPRADNRRAANWSQSDETDKSQWVQVEHTGVMDHGLGACDELHVLLRSAGQVLLDDVEVRVEGGPNLVVNSDFAGGMSGWEGQGNHVHVRWYPEEGCQSDHSLLVEASGGGDTGPNRVRVPLAQSLDPGTTVTLRARARWLAGHRQVLLRLKGSYLEAMGDLHIPENLGTPGLPNSVLMSNIGPAIYDARHTPVLPAAGEPVVVTARAHDPDGVASMTLYYRVDPDTSYQALPMNDAGAGADEIADDGIHTAEIPGQSQETLVAWHIEAVDGNASPAAITFPVGLGDYDPDNISQHEALIRFGENASDMEFVSTFRVWLTDAVVNRLESRHALSNHRVPGTLVYGNRVIHNIAYRYRGSPYTRLGIGGKGSGFSFQVPRDDRLLAAREFNIGKVGSDYTRQRERTSHWIAEKLGLPVSHVAYVRLHENASGGGSFSYDIHHINSDYMQTWFPGNEEEELFKVDDWFEFYNDMSDFRRTGADFGIYESDGVKKKARYRWNWEKRSNGWLDDDYTDFFHLVDAVNTPDSPDYTSAVNTVADVEQWMRIFSIRRITSDKDGYGDRRGKNAWLCKTETGIWKMILWDLDTGIIPNSSTDGDLFGSHDPVIRRMLEHPPFRRAYLRAFHDAVHGPLTVDEMHPVLDEVAASLDSDGFNSNPSGIKDWIHDRRAYIQSVVAGENASWALSETGPVTTDQSLYTLSGSAPVQAATLSVNGIAYPTTWSTATDWEMPAPLVAGENQLVVEGFDTDGDLLYSSTLSVTYTGPEEHAEDFLAINEIMCDPLAPDSEFVEIHNHSTGQVFDLTGYRLKGVDFDFAPGTLLDAGDFLLVVRDRNAFEQAYGSELPVTGVYSGVLQPDGERLRLVRSATETEPELLVDDVTYRTSPPWPTEASGSGASLQRLDPARSGDHPGNWTAVSAGDPGAPDPNTPGAMNSVGATLPPWPPLWINEIQPRNQGTVTDGHGEADSWVELYNAGTETLSLDGFFLSNDPDQPFLWSFPAGAVLEPGSFTTVWLDGQPEQTTDEEWHTGFTINPYLGSMYLCREVDDIGIVMDWLDYSAIAPDRSYGLYPDGDPDATRLFLAPTPGQANDTIEWPLLHYWHFSDALPNDTPFETLDSTYNLVSPAHIEYNSALAGYPFTSDHENWRKASMERRNRPTEINYRPVGNQNLPYDEDTMRGIQVRQPFAGDGGENTLVFHLPTTDYQDVLFSFAARDDGAADGLVVDYSVAAGEAVWRTSDLPTHLFDLVDEYQLYEVDFSQVPLADDNPDFKVRVRFDVVDGSADEGDRAMFNNIALDGVPHEGTNLPPQLVQTIPFTTGIEQESFTIDLSPLFEDPDDDPLNFTAVSDVSSPDIVDVAVSDGILTVTPQYRGETVVTVSADDGHNPPVPTEFRLLVYPEAHTVATGDFSFGSWDPDTPERNYPGHMLFLQSDQSDTALDTPLQYAYHLEPDEYHDDDIAAGTVGFPYNNTGRTRINGLNENGIAFVNTGRDRDLGGALLALDTRGIDGAEIEWGAGTVLKNTRVYAIRLQYRVGTSGDFTDFTLSGGPVEYIRSSVDGDFQTVPAAPLPTGALGEQYVQVLWRYYRIDEEDDSGPRAQLRLDDVAVRETDGVAVPSAPTSLAAAAASSSRIDLSWTDNAPDEDGFKIERKEGGGTWGQIDTVAPNVTEYSDTGLSALTTYTYRVRAWNSGGNSAYSNEDSATTSENTLDPPAAPSGLAASAVSSSGIDLSWTDNASDEDGFKIERKTGSGGTWSQIDTAGANVTSYSNTGLSASTLYYYRVRAWNSDGDSAYSNEDSATTDDGTSPSGASIAVNFFNNGYGGYGLLDSDTAGVEAQTNWNNYAQNNPTTGLAVWNGSAWVAKGSQSYVDGDGNSTTLSVSYNLSNPVDGADQGTASGDEKLMSGTSQAGSGGADSSSFSLSNVPYSSYDVIVYMAEPKSHSGSYIVTVTDGTTTYYIDEGGFSEIHTQSSATSEGAVGGEATYVRFSALSGDATISWNNNGTSWKAGAAGFQIVSADGGTVDPPAAPSGLAASTVSSSRIDLSWTDNSSDEDGFKIERKTGSGGTWSVINTTGADTTSYSDTGLAASTTYYYRVRAYNSGGDSAYSNEDSATTNIDPDSYEAWKQSEFSGEELNDPDISGPLADPDNSGLVNLLRYAFGLGRYEEYENALPEAGVDEGQYIYSHRRLINPADVQYVIRICDDLAACPTEEDWNDAIIGLDVEELEVTPVDGETEVVRYRVNPDRFNTKRFLRLKVVLE